QEFMAERPCGFESHLPHHLFLFMPHKKYLLLINPWIYDFTACDFWLKPLGLLYLAAILKKYTYLEVKLLDCLDCSLIDSEYNFKKKRRLDGRASFYKEEVSKPEFFKSIPRKFSRYGLPLAQVKSRLDHLPPPEAVLITCTMTYWYPGVQTAVELIKEKFGRVPVILGGIYATLCPEHARNQSGAEVIVKGPGENQILSLIGEISGPQFLKPEAVEAFFPDFDQLPSPSYELYENNSVICLMTSRGCPFRCTYCASNLLCSQFEQRRPEKVVEEISFFSKTLKPRHIAFYDDALLVNREEHLVKILEVLGGLNLELKFHTPNGLHPRQIDRQLAQLLKKAGFESLFLSLETSDLDLLATTGAKVHPTDLEKALAYLEETGFERSKISVYLLVGHPAQSREQVVESIRLVKKFGARPRLAYYSPVPGTADWKKLLEIGALKPDSDPLLHNKLVFPYFWSRISPDDLEGIKKEVSS
ncbi:MAG: B12-binding domain-containing radical SAM protein, partial [Candidatus Saccharicenans sp.]